MGYPDYDAQVGALGDARRELARARSKFAAFASGHEGLAIIEEEFLELRQEVFWGKDKAALRVEAVQLAAMALRFIEDVCDKPAARA